LYRMTTGFQIDVYRGGIMDKTMMDEAALRTHWHDSGLWV